LAKHDPGGGLSQAQIGVKTVHVNFVHPLFVFTAVLRFWRGLIITFIVTPYILSLLFSMFDSQHTVVFLGGNNVTAALLSISFLNL
jgi:hypothetical protein